MTTSTSGCEKTVLSIAFDASEAATFPVYHKYESQFAPQRAYLELDCRSGDLSADYDGNIGGGVPFPVFHNLILRFSLPAELHRDEIATVIDQYKNRFQQILDGFSEEWSGSNYVGRFNREAANLVSDLEMEFDDLPASEFFMVDEDGLEEWLCFPFCNKNQSIDEYALEVIALNGYNDCYLTDDLLDPDSMKAAILNLWAECLYNGDSLPAHIAKILISEETCADSAWMEELTEFANA